MFAVLSLLVILFLSVVIVRVATVALTLTGLSQQSAKFQARSAFTGTGFTTDESESVVNHPVRRRIIMLLMFIRNGGIVTIVATLVLSFVNVEGSEQGLWRLVVLIGGLALLWMLSVSSWLDQHMQRIIDWAFRRWTKIDTRDYANLLHLHADYRIVELRVDSGDWVANQTLADARLPDEGVIVLGIQRKGGQFIGAPRGESTPQPGDTLLLYGRQKMIEEIDERKVGYGGNYQHLESVAEHRHRLREQAEQDEQVEQAADEAST